MTDPGSAEAGRAAARATWRDGLGTVPEPADPTRQYADSALDELAQCVLERSAIDRASAEGAEQGAASLSGDALQGLAEVIQNADDQGARKVSITVRDTEAGEELLVVHDGRPVQLDHVVAMAFPWITTKRSDAAATGRFGIGLKTLNTLGGPLQVHCPPYHAELLNQTVRRVPPEEPVPSFYEPAARETLLRLPLAAPLPAAAVKEWLENIAASGLVFLRSVRNVCLLDGDGDGDGVVIGVTVVKAPSSISLEGLAATVDELHDSDGVRWTRYSVDAPVPAGLVRRGKATANTTPVQIAFPDRTASCRIHAALPVEPTGLPFAINGQFDPETGRQHLLGTDWNSWLLRQVGRLATAVANRRLADGSPTAWAAVPLASDVVGTASPELAEALLAHLIRPCAEKLKQDAILPSSGDTAYLEELDYEDASLEDLVGPREVAHLVGPDVRVLSHEQRDNDGRWRRVLTGLGLPPAVRMSEALQLFEVTTLGWGPAEVAELASLALADAATRATLASHACVVLADGTRTAPPDPQSGTKLVEALDDQSLAARLGLARAVHPTYLAARSEVVEWLRSRSSLATTHDSPSAVVHSLARIAGTVPLRPADLTALRDAFDALPDEQRRQLGPQVGRRVTLPCRRAVDGRWEELAATPSRAYLPGSIDRVRDSWARAAGKTPGLVWLAGEVDDALKGAGREVSGSIKFLKLLGAATGPRLHEPTGTLQHFRRTPVRVTPIDTRRPKTQLAEIQAPPHTPATHLRDDRASADLTAVARSIAAGKSADRPARARALLATLSRGWGDYQDQLHAEAVLAYDGYYRPQRTVTASWLAELRDIAWVPTARSRAARPAETAVRTPVTEVVYGRDASFVAASIVAGARPEVLRAVGIRLDPAASALLDQLADIRKDEQSGTVRETAADDCRALYRLLADHARRTGPGAAPGRVDDVTLGELRRRFAAGSGLVRTDVGWRPPAETLRGRPIFGRHRPWAPGGLETLPLWTALQIREPAASDCIAVVHELARGRSLEESNEGVVLEALERLADLAPSLADADREALRRLPLWSGRKWLRARPVALLDDDALAQALPEKFAVWSPPLPLAKLLPLLAPLRVQPIDAASAATTEVAPVAQVLGEAHRERFSRACQHLASELPRSDIALAKTARVELSRLAAAPVLLVPGLGLRLPHPAGPVNVPVRAHVRLDPLAWLVADEHAGGAPDGAALAVARLFSGDRQKVAWAWTAMWHKAGDSSASAGRAPALSREPSRDDPLDALVASAPARSKARVASATASRDAPVGGPVPEAAAGAEGTAAPAADGPPRRLKHPSTLIIEAASLVRPGARPAGVTVPRRRGLRNLDTLPSRDSAPKGPPQPATQYTPDDREHLALEVLRMLLDAEPEDLVDVSALRGIGADALGSDNRPFELKTAGREMPDHVTLTANEAERAAKTPGFCLVVVAGLEEGQDTKIVVVVDPLDALPLHFSGDVTVSDLRSRLRDVPSASNAGPTG